MTTATQAPKNGAARPPETRTTAIQPQKAAGAGGGPLSLVDMIKAKQSSFAEVATKYLTPERLVKLAIVAVTKMPDMQKVPAQEIVAELINCARLGLEPNVEGGRWLLPFKRNTDDGARYELVAVTDYRGLIDIARRSGEVLAIHADVVREHDLWENWVDAGGPTLVHLRHRRAEGERGNILGAYAIVKLKNGEVQARFVTLEEIGRAQSKSRGSASKFSPWTNDWDAMACKTAIRRLYTLLPKTPEIQAAREVLAEEEERDRSDTAIDVTPAVPGATRTEGVKAKLAAKLGKAPATHEDEVAALDAEASGGDASPDADTKAAADVLAGSAPVEDLEVKFGKNKGKQLSECSDGDVRYLIGRWESDLADPEKSKFHANAERSIVIGRAILASRSRAQAAPESSPGSDGETSPFND